MIELINALQSGPWVPLIIVVAILAIGTVTLVRIYTASEKEADLRNKDHALRMIEKNGALTKIDHR